MPSIETKARRVNRKVGPVRHPMRSVSLAVVGLGFGGVWQRIVSYKEDGDCERGSERVR